MIRNITLWPASRRISATCVHTAVLSAADTWYFNIPMSSVTIYDSAMEHTCIVISRTVVGAGLTSVISCAAADSMSDPAD
jgi:hypothetical protein